MQFDRFKASDPELQKHYEIEFVLAGVTVSFPRVATLECNNCRRKPPVGMWDTPRRFVPPEVFILVLHRTSGAIVIYYI